MLLHCLAHCYGAVLLDIMAVACRYYEEKGFEVILVSRVLNLLALAFTIAFSAFLLLFVKWHALRSECILKDTCDISEARTAPVLLHASITQKFCCRLLLGPFSSTCLSFSRCLFASWSWQRGWICRWHSIRIH